MFLGDGSQWTDTDGDGYGDNQLEQTQMFFQWMLHNLKTLIFTIWQ